MVEDGIHLSDNRTHIFAENFEEFLRNFIFEAYKTLAGTSKQQIENIKNNDS